MKYIINDSIKAQMELLGLAFLVVIIVILFVIMNTRPENIIESKQDTILYQNAQATLTQILNLKTECGASFFALIKNCYKSNDLCGGCDYAKTELKKTLDKYFSVYNYHFSANKGTERKIEIGNCREKLASAIQIIPIFPENIRIELEICK